MRRLQGLVQIANPARGRGRDLDEIQAEMQASCRRIDEEFGQPGYEPIVFIDRQGASGSESSSDSNAPKKSMLVVSEFIGCSPSLSGAIRINPWNVDATAEAMNEAISMAEPEKQLRHEKHYRYVSTHDVAYWSRSFLQDMERTCKEHFRRRCWGIGLSFGFRVVALDPNFRKLSIDTIVSSYARATPNSPFHSQFVV